MAPGRGVGQATCPGLTLVLVPAWETVPRHGQAPVCPISEDYARQLAPVRVLATDLSPGGDQALEQVCREPAQGPQSPRPVTLAISSEWPAPFDPEAEAWPPPCLLDRGLETGLESAINRGLVTALELAIDRGLETGLELAIDRLWEAART